MSEILWVKIYCKKSDIFASFCRIWDFLAENLKLVDKANHREQASYGPVISNSYSSNLVAIYKVSTFE